MPRKATPSLEDFSTAIVAIHDAGVDATSWPAALERLGGLFGSCGVVISTRLNSAGGIRAYLVNEESKAMIRGYADHYGRLDVLRQAVVRAPVATILTTRMVVPWSDLVRSEFYCDFMARHDLYDGIEAQALSDPEFRVGVAVLCSSRVGVFEQEDVRLLALLLPHLRRAFRTHMRLSSLGIERDCALEAFDRLSHGVLIVDAQARVIFANSAAETILRAGEGLGVDIAGGRRLRAENAGQTAVLRQLIARAAGTAALSGSRSNGMLHLDCGAGEPFLVCASPLRPETPWNAAPKPAALLLVSAPRPVATSAGLRALYGLTPAEVAATHAIARGQGVESAAKALGVAPSTVRWHLQHVYQKTGTARQAELIRLTERLCALTGNGREGEPQRENIDGQ